MLMTWLPVPNFRSSALSLSDQHLDDQRLYILELLEFFHDVEKSELPEGYVKQYLSETAPIVKMWLGYEVQLAEYGLEVSEEWSTRHRRTDPMYDKIMFHLDCALSEDADMGKPNWFGDVDFHVSHQHALVERDKVHYTKHYKVVGKQLVVWPVSIHAKTP